MLNIPWYGWVALAVGALIVACMVASEVIEDRELKRRRAEEVDEAADESAEIAAAKRECPPEATRQPQTDSCAPAANVGERRVPRYEIEREADGRVIAEDTAVPGAMAYGATAAEAKRKVERIAASAHAKPRSRKEAPTRKAKKARGRR